MFSRIFVEKRVLDTKEYTDILQRIDSSKIELIDDISSIWGRVKKPYLQKRENLNLYIGKKDGALLKEAPDAYGLGDEKHYYYVHAYNCVYECQYCYLQGYFNTPDIVLYINHDEILQEMQKTANQFSDCWFHAGEFSDSLALSHFTNEIPKYFDFFKANPTNKLELRTKSVNTKELEKLAPLPNVYLSFSLSSHKAAKLFDNKCPSIKARLKAIKKMREFGYNIGIHFDPVVYSENFKEEYIEVFKELNEAIELNEISYLSLGVVRYTKDVYREVKNNYPKSEISNGPYINSFDSKIRYNRPMRNWILNTLKNELTSLGAKPDVIYLCME